MSSQLQLPQGVAIPGGLATRNQDLAASIVFVALYFFLVPLTVLRFARAPSRTTVLIRPAVFILVRIATFLVRSITANDGYTTSRLITELILLLCGFILICEPLLSMLGAHITRNTLPSIDNKDLWVRVVKVLKLALLAALILGVVAGSTVSNTYDGNTSALSSYKSERNANAVICLVVTAVVIPLTLVAHGAKSLPLATSLHLCLCSGLLVVVSAYKLYIYLNPQPLLSVRTKIMFYCLNALPEWLVTLFYLIVNIQDMYQLNEHGKRMKEEKNMKKAAKKGGNRGGDIEMGSRVEDTGVNDWRPSDSSSLGK